MTILILSLAACSEGSLSSAAADSCEGCASDLVGTALGADSFAGTDGPSMSLDVFEGNKDIFNDDAGGAQVDASHDAPGEGGPDGTPPNETADIATAAGSYKGENPPYDAPIESFTEVYDQTGAVVGVEDLTGSWTVLWFFPKASTFG